jgi:nickel transport protein
VLTEYPDSASSAQILFTDGTVITIGANTNFKVHEYLYEEGSKNSNLKVGVTDDAGVWRFDVTQAMRHAPKGLELEINAGEGHQNQWSIPADELAAADGAGASELPAAAPVSTRAMRCSAVLLQPA